MKKTDLDSLWLEVKKQIEEKGIVENELCFDNMLIKEDLCEFDMQQLLSELYYLDGHWNIDLDYAIPRCGKISSILRKFIKKLRTIILLHFSGKQNAINYSTTQCLKLIQMYMIQMYEKQCELEKEIEELKTKLKQETEV